MSSFKKKVNTKKPQGAGKIRMQGAKPKAQPSRKVQIQQAMAESDSEDQYNNNGNDDQLDNGSSASMEGMDDEFDLDQMEEDSAGENNNGYVYDMLRLCPYYYCRQTPDFLFRITIGFMLNFIFRLLMLSTSKFLLLYVTHDDFINIKFGGAWSNNFPIADRETINSSTTMIVMTKMTMMMNFLIKERDSRMTTLIGWKSR